MQLNAIEQELLNVAALFGQTIGTAAAAKNPAYASVISTGQSAIQAINTAVNPGSSVTVTTLANDTAAAVQPATAAVGTLLSKSATPAAKASAITALIGVAEEIIPDAIKAFEAVFAKSAPVVTPTPVTAS
jgi:hypothetical protein